MKGLNVKHSEQRLAHSKNLKILAVITDYFAVCRC